MPIWSNNPVLEREIRGRLRLRRKGGLPANLWIARALGLVVLYYYLRGLLALGLATRQDARDLWPLLVNGALALIVLLSPALSATAITQEREQQTWETLTTTRLTGAEVLLGKWLGRQLIPWLLVLVLLPYMAVCAGSAQFGFLMLPAVVGFLLVTTACYSALGLLCSFQARRTMTATAAALTVAALLCIGTLIVNQVWNMLLGAGSYPSQESPALWLNPFSALTSLTSQLLPEDAGTNVNTDPFTTLCYLLSTIAFTVLALGFMVRRYRHAVRERS